jgi:hypothetical protein
MKKFIVFFAAIAMVGAFAFSAVAADWSFYGSARMATFSVDESEEVSGTSGGDKDTLWDLQGNSRLGANVAAGDVTGRFEFAVDDVAGVTTRILFGEWDFGAGKLGVGQHYTPTTILYSNQVFGNDGDLLGWGATYDGRRPMVRLKFGGFQVAFLKPQADLVAGFDDTDTTLPKIAMKYAFKTDRFFVDVYGGYNTADQVVTATDTETSIDSSVFGVGGGMNFGAFYFKANVYGAVNGGNYGLSNAEGTDEAIYTGTDFEDVDTIGALLLVGFKMSDMFTFEAGYGFIENSVDIAGVDLEDNANSLYVNAVITLAPGVFVVPEFGIRDYDDATVGGVSVDQGDVTYVGAKWQINF